MDMNIVLSGLNKITLKHRDAINVSCIDNEIEITVIRKNSIKRFKDINTSTLLSQVQNYLHS